MSTADQRNTEQAPPPPRPLSSVFRPEAIEHHSNSTDDASAPLRLSTVWTRRTFRLIGLMASISVLFLITIHVNEWAEGPAVVRLDDREDVTATFSATVATVRVRPGDLVAQGDELVRLVVDDQRAELERIERERELQLVRIMRDPSDVAAKQSLSSLWAQEELAHARVARGVIRAPSTGVVSDIRVRPGQHLSVGELVLTVVGANTPLSIIAVLPGKYRPDLRPGMSLRLELDGYRYHYEDLRVESVSNTVIGPSEVRRYLGPQTGDTVPADGPSVFVTARLRGRAFVADGERRMLYDGLSGRAQVAIRSERAILTLVPGLRQLASPQ